MIDQTILLLTHTDCTHPVLKKHAEILGQKVNWDPDLRVGAPLRQVFGRVIEFDVGISYAESGVIETNRIITGIVRTERPKYVLWPTMSFEILESTFTDVREMGSYVVGWFFDDECRFDDYSRWWIPYMDYILTTDELSIPRYEQLGARALHLLVTADAWFFKPALSERSWDVSFIGTKAVADRDDLVELLAQDGIDVSTFGRGWQGGYVTNDEIRQIYGNSKINLCFTKSYGVGTRNQLKSKIFDITMCGGFLLCEYVDGIEKLFEIGKEIVCFTTYEEALIVIRYYLSEDEERIRIARAGRERSVLCYDQKRLLEECFAVLERETEAKAPATRNPCANAHEQLRSGPAYFHLQWADVLRMEGFEERRWREEFQLACMYEPDFSALLEKTDSGDNIETRERDIAETVAPGKILLINGYRVGSPVLPTGLGYVAQAVEDAGFPFEICDVNIQSHDEIIEAVKKSGCRYVGLGTMTHEVEANYRLLEEIIRSVPGVTIILGGPHALAAQREIFDECPAIDIVIQGEGEVSLVKLLQGEDFQRIPGILTKDVVEASPHVPLDITKIAFPRYNGFRLDKYDKAMNIASSRGCVYRCSFCGAPKFLGKKWRAFSAERMYEEFRYWHAKGYREFYLSDSLFALDKERVNRFCRYIVEGGYSDISFTADGIRGDHLTYEVLQHLKAAKFTKLILGVESVHDKTLQFFNKGETFAQIDAAIAMADSLGFDILVYLIIGAPTESYDEALQTIYYPLRYKNIVTAIYSKLMPIKGTPYHQYAVENGLVENPDIYYPAHEVAGFNTRNDSQNAVEEMWTRLMPQMETMSAFIAERTLIRNALNAACSPEIDVHKLNILTHQHLRLETGGGEAEMTFSDLTRMRDPEDLIRRLRALDIEVDQLELDVNDFLRWLHEYREVYYHYATAGDVTIEKCLEHYLSHKFFGLKPGQVYIDVAASTSNWSDILLKKGINAYSLDLTYEKGISGNKIGANAGATGLPAGSVDAMSLQCAFETFEGDDDQTFVKECARILKEGGNVVISPLYLDTRHFILSGKGTDPSKVLLDEGAIRVWREDEYNEPFSRHYSPESLADRIFSWTGELSAKVSYIGNLDQLRKEFPGQRIYCDFLLHLSKPQHRVADGAVVAGGSALYNEAFYNEQRDGSYRSAQAIVPIIADVFKPKSVTDIGCGVGGWLHVFSRYGATTLCGYDANDLTAENYFIDKRWIKTKSDFSDSNFTVAERSDLLVCLEVAEHLPSEVADHFVRTLTNASPVVVFSAALPGQTGTNHINEQPPWYWREKFNAVGYVEVDFIRPQVLSYDDVCWWYRQNITCFADPRLLSQNTKLAELTKVHGQNPDKHKLTVVSEWVLRRILSGEYLHDLHAASQPPAPFLSVIIPTRNRAALLYETLESIMKQTYPPDLFEVIVVDNGSTDSTAEICQHFGKRIKNLQRIYDPRPGLHVGRHAGCKASRGEILVYCDDDIEALPTWLEGVAKSFSRPEVGLVGGKILPKFEDQPPQWIAELSTMVDRGWALGWYSILDFGDDIHEIPHDFVWGCNFSIRKRVLEAIGGFHPDAFPQELIRYRGDGETAVAIAVREAGYRALYNPEASVRHFVSKQRMTQEYIYQRSYNQGISDSYTHIRKYRAAAVPMHYAQTSETIQDVIDRGHADGFNFHQQLVIADPRLLEWVTKDNYFDNPELPA